MILWFIFLFTQCEASTSLQSRTFVLIVAGQSNTHYGFSYDRSKDTIDFSRVLQIPSYNAGLVTAVREGDIRHFSKQTDKIGFITRAAVKFRDNHVGKGDRVVIIPAGAGGSGWADYVYQSDNHWRSNGKFFQDLVARINFARDQLLGEFSALLWHQGETDAWRQTKNYQYILQTFIATMREHIGDFKCPFVLGEMVEVWVKGVPERLKVQVSRRLILIQRHK